MTIIKMLSIHSFSRRRLGLQQIGPSSRWSPSSFRASNCLAVAALLTFTLIFFYISYFDSFDLDVLQEKFPKHQIPILMAAGKKQWAAMLGRQSRTLDEAVIEYRIRYALEPPDGFDTWYYYAQSQNVTLIDEYDLLMRSLEPLRQLGPQELRRRTELLNRAPVDINLLRVKANGQDCTLEVLHKIGARKERTMGLMEMLEPVQHLLAEQDWEKFDVVVNELAESRVVGGEWHTDALDEGLAGSLAGYMLTKAIWEKHDFGERSLIDSVMTACGEESNFTRANPGFVVQSREDGGVEEEEEPKLESLNWLDDTDICNHPELPQVGQTLLSPLFEPGACRVAVGNLLICCWVLAPLWIPHSALHHQRTVPNIIIRRPKRLRRHPNPDYLPIRWQPRLHLKERRGQTLGRKRERYILAG